MSVLVVLFVWNHTHYCPPHDGLSLFQGWKPPFSVNVETFRFTPRLQPLNELEVLSEIHKEVKKLNKNTWANSLISLSIIGCQVIWCQHLLLVKMLSSFISVKF